MAKRPRTAAKGGRYHHGALRQALVMAALEMLEEEGLGALGLRAVARRVGVSQTAPYRHFADKAALLAATARAGFEALDAALRDGTARHRAPAPRMAAMGRAYVAFARTRPATFRLMFGPSIGDKSRHAELVATAQATYQTLRAATGAALDAAGGAADPEIASLAAWSLVHGLANLLVDGQIAAARDQPAVVERMIDEVLLTLYRGIGPRA